MHVGVEMSGGAERARAAAAGAPTIGRMPLVPPSCHCCLAPARDDRPPEHTGWYVLTSRDGELLGLACAGCVADEELLVVELEGALASA
jgi:hypothetical protein